MYEKLQGFKTKSLKFEIKITAVSLKVPRAQNIIENKESKICVFYFRLGWVI